MKFREIANGASGRQFDRESKYPLPVALMVIGTRKIGIRKKTRRPIRLRFKLMCPRSRYQRRLQLSVGRVNFTWVPDSYIQSQPLSIASFMPAPYSAGEPPSLYRN